jgi:transposase
MLCGVAPVPAMTGLINNHYRLNIGGNRHANNAMWRIVLTRLGQHEPRTVAYMNRRLAEGKTKRYIIRCLKRYVARETFRALPR